MPADPPPALRRRRCLPGLAATALLWTVANAGNDTPPAPMTKSPRPPVPMVAGPPLRPAPALLDWLQQHTRTADGRRRRLRLPVTVEFGDQHRLAWQQAYLGGGEAGADRLPVRLDDSGLSIALIDTLRQRCPAPAPVCRCWVEGYWGALVAMPGAGAGTGSAPPGRPPVVGTVAVLRVVGGGEEPSGSWEVIYAEP